MDEKQLHTLFMKAFGENIANAYKALTILEEDIANSTQIENLHRFFHSLKSESLTMGYKLQGISAKEHEDFLYNVIHNTGKLDKTVLQKMKATLKDFQEFLSSLESQIPSI